MKELECVKCDIRWWPRDPRVKPKVCPACHTRKWEREKVKA